MLFIFSAITGVLSALVVMAARVLAERQLVPKLKVVSEENTNASSLVNGLSVKPIVLHIIIGVISGGCVYFAVLTQEGMSFFGLVKIVTSVPVLAVCSLTDLRTHRISNKASLFLVLVRIFLFLIEIAVFGLVAALKGISGSAAGAALCLSLLLFSAVITHGGIGAGDIKIFSSLAFLCGTQAVLFTLLFSFVLCAGVSLLLIVRKEKTHKDYIPMGPFIYMGFLLTVVLGIG